MINSARETDKWVQATLTGEIYFQGIDLFVWVMRIIYSSSLNVCFHFWCSIRLLERSRWLRKLQNSQPSCNSAFPVVINTSRTVKYCTSSEPWCHLMTFHDIYHITVHREGINFAIFVVSLHWSQTSMPFCLPSVSRATVNITVLSSSDILQPFILLPSTWHVQNQNFWTPGQSENTGLTF